MSKHAAPLPNAINELKLNDQHQQDAIAADHDKVCSEAVSPVNQVLALCGRIIHKQTTGIELRTLVEVLGSSVSDRAEFAAQMRTFRLCGEIACSIADEVSRR